MKKHLLLIDDDKAIHDSLEIIFGSKYDLTYCRDINSGLKILDKKKKPDLILLDLVIQEESGFTFLDKVRGRIAAPIIVVSSNDTATAATEAMKRGASDYITKPFNIPEITSKVAELLK